MKSILLTTTAIVAFAGDGPAADDQTILVVKVADS